ncbi:ABC transporter ATP-binding protein [Sulfolobus tengchongensis]|uniref:ABC transporter ATP-binding protein n=1 Tax=Sulfolobus tengchongensis TaxID=207809 RepID=A0AAX4KY17_9CREN
MLRVVNVTKVIHDNVIINSVSFEIKGNERVGIVGIHNSGKTVLMEILAGKMKPTYGEISLADKRKIAYMPQVPRFIPTIRVKDVMSYITRRYDYLELVGLDGNKKVKDLSLDEKKRLSFALSLPFSPTYLLVDDLSPISSSTRHLIKNFKGGIILAHHNLKDIWDLIDRVIIISRGKIVFDGVKEELEYKIIRFKDEEIWEKEKENSVEKDLNQKGINYEVIRVTPDEVFLYFYAGV